jgi:uncharacterized protein YjbI with pentapeptide repeats
MSDPTADAPKIGIAWGDGISEERQRELNAILAAWDAETDHGNRTGPFADVRLTGADVSWLVKRTGPGLVDRIFHRAPNLHLEGADLRDAHLERARLSEAHLEAASLGEAFRGREYLSPAHLEGADLNAAQLEGARLGGAHLERVDFSDAHLEGADLTVTRLEEANFYHAHLAGANLSEAHLEGADLSERIWRGEDTRPPIRA